MGYGPACMCEFVHTPGKISSQSMLHKGMGEKFDLIHTERQTYLIHSFQNSMEIKNSNPLKFTVVQVLKYSSLKC